MAVPVGVGLEKNTSGGMFGGVSGNGEGVGEVE